jgi:uncharacterized protein YegP (UPF0339 family)
VSNSCSRIIVEIYQAGREGNVQWFWRIRRRRNRKILADGSEGYYKKGNARRAVDKFLDAAYVDILTLDGGPEIKVLD